MTPTSDRYTSLNLPFLLLRDWPHGFPGLFTDTSELIRFYRAMLCIRGTSHAWACVCLSVSVTSRSSTKTAKRRITQTTLHDGPGTLVF